MFTQQGLEKLNDLSTKYFQRGSNHREDEALRQMLERMNRLEPLKMLDIAEKKDLKSVASVVVWATTNILVLLDHAGKNMTRTAVDR